MESIRTKFEIGSVFRSAGLAVVAAFAFRLLVLWLMTEKEGASLVDFHTMGLESLMIGKSLAVGHGFSSPMPHYEAVTAWLAPVFPAILALGYKFLNDYNVIVFSQIVNSLFSAATCWPIFYVGRRLFSEKIGLAAAWLWVFLPIAVLMPLEWTWDQSLSALMLMIVLSVTLMLREDSSRFHWSGYGLLWAATALVNPTICVLLPFLGLWLLWTRRQSHRASSALLLRAALFFVLALIPWTARNYFEVGGLTFVKSNFGLELWLGNNSEVKEVFKAERHPAFDVRERLMLILSGEPNYMHAKEAQAVAFIRKYPVTFARLSWGRIIDTWTATYDSTVDSWVNGLRINRMYVWVTAVSSFFSILGMVFALQKEPVASLPLAFCVIIFPLPYYITHTAMRYRHPIDPVLAILVVVAIGRLAAIFLNRNKVAETSPVFGAAA